jgi:hypothetical protein
MRRDGVIKRPWFFAGALTAWFVLKSGPSMDEQSRNKSAVWSNTDGSWLKPLAAFEKRLS